MANWKNKNAFKNESIMKQECFVGDKAKSREMLCNINSSLWQSIQDTFLADDDVLLQKNPASTMDKA